MQTSVLYSCFGLIVTLEFQCEELLYPLPEIQKWKIPRGVSFPDAKHNDELERTYRKTEEGKSGDLTFEACAKQGFSLNICDGLENVFIRTN